MFDSDSSWLKRKDSGPWPSDILRLLAQSKSRLTSVLLEAGVNSTFEKPNRRTGMCVKRRGLFEPPKGGEFRKAQPHAVSKSI